MNKVNLRQLREIVKMAYQIKRPVIALSSPGIGKSSSMIQVAKELEINYKVVEASGLDPTDTRGIPYVYEGESKYGIPSMLPDIERDGKTGILIIDEIASCMPAVQVALYSLFLERRLGEFHLPEGWIPMATGNFAKDGAIAFNLSTALIDRALIIEVIADFQMWKEDFAIPQQIDQRIISFLGWKESNFYTFDKRDKNSTTKSFATPRSYEMASDVLKNGNLKGATLNAVLASCLGNGVAIELIGFLNTWESLPNIYHILDGSYKEVPKDKPDVMYALIGAIISGIQRLPKEITINVAIENVINYSLKMPTEFGGLLITDILKTNEKWSKEMIKVSNWKIWKDKYMNLIVA